MNGPSYNTLLLNVEIWDLSLDAAGNIALATLPYAVAQDVASACRTWRGELWYDTTLGVDFESLLWTTPGASAVQQAFNQQALTVSSVATAATTIMEFAGSTGALTGQIAFTASTGSNLTVSF